MSINNTNGFYPTVIQGAIVNGNDLAFEKLKKSNQTIYGSIAYSIEKNKTEINAAANTIARYLAEKRALEITREYEKSRSLYEKLIKNNELEQRQMEIKREFETKCIAGGVQLICKGGVWCLEKLLDKIDKKKVNDSIWSMCLRYCSMLTDNLESRPALHFMMIFIHNQLYGESKKSIDFSFNEDKNSCIYVNSNDDAISKATILYYLYTTAHYNSRLYATKEKDLQNMFLLWSEMGIFGNTQDNLLNKLECLNIANSFEWERMNKLIHSLYSNLSITLPDIDHKLTARINDELLNYIPNGDKQKVARRTAKIITKSSIAATSGIIGVSSGNPVLISAAAASAASLLKDLSRTDIIGNCFADAGLNEEEVKKCLDYAKNSKRNKNILND